LLRSKRPAPNRWSIQTVIVSLTAGELGRIQPLPLFFKTRERNSLLELVRASFLCEPRDT